MEARLFADTFVTHKELYLVIHSFVLMLEACR